MKKTRGLVITPFDAAGRRVLDAVHSALEEIGVQVFRLDNIQAGALWANAVTDAVRSSDFLVVDVTRQNPNVLYELGFAHALRKPTILIASSEGGGALPTDLAGFQYIVYEPDNLRGLVEHVQRSASGLVSKEDERA
jgi:hypothetical protein